MCSCVTLVTYIDVHISMYIHIYIDMYTSIDVAYNITWMDICPCGHLCVHEMSYRYQCPNISLLPPCRKRCIYLQIHSYIHIMLDW